MPTFDFTTGSLPSGATLTRASQARVRGSNGTLNTAAVDAARFDYSSGGTLLGLMVEASTVNNSPYSEQFDNAAWVKQNANSSNPVVTANNVAAPNGATTAERVVFPAVSSAGQISQISVIAIDNAQILAPRSGGVWLRGASGGEKIRLNCRNNTGTLAAAIEYTLTTVWQQYGQTDVLAAESTTLLSLQVNFNQQGGLPQQTIYVWGAQIETSPYPSSYVATPTTTATQPRSADALVLNWGSLGVANGTYDTIYTFDDNSTQTVSTTVSNGTTTVPTNLNRSRIRTATINNVINAQASLTEGDDTTQSTASAPARGTASVAEAPDTASGMSVGLIRAQAAINEDADTSTGTGVVINRAQSSMTEGADTVVAQVGSNNRYATATITEGDDTTQSAGQVLNRASASLVEAADTSSGMAGLIAMLSGAMTEAGDTSTGAGRVVVSAMAALVEDGDTSSATVRPIVRGVSTMVEDADTSTGEGVVVPISPAARTVMVAEVAPRVVVLTR